MADDEAPEPTPPKRRDKGELPFSEDSDRLDGRAWNRKPLVVLGVVLAVAAAIALLIFGFNSATSDDGGSEVVDVPVTRQTTTTTSTTTTSTTTTSTTAPPPTTTAPPTNACSPEEGDPDCIDPDGDGDYELIVGGASCLATTENPRDCIDTDDDGAAGPPARDD